MGQQIAVRELIIRGANSFGGRAIIGAAESCEGTVIIGEQLAVREQ